DRRTARLGLVDPLDVEIEEARHAGSHLGHLGATNAGRADVKNALEVHRFAPLRRSLAPRPRCNTWSIGAWGLPCMEIAESPQSLDRSTARRCEVGSVVILLGRGNVAP